MPDTAAMTHHGIMNCLSQYWVHLHPFDGAAYWYSVSVCRKFIARKSLPIIMAGSKDGTPNTGGGYLIPKSTYFVHHVRVPQSFLDGYDWVSFTDRQAGLAGQDVVEALVDAELLTFPIRTVQFLNDMADQNSGRDLRVAHWGTRDVEVKCERKSTGNLYVQSHERGHNPHVGLDSNGKPETRVTSWDEQ